MAEGQDTDVWIPRPDQVPELGSEPYVGDRQQFGMLDKRKTPEEQAPLMGKADCAMLHLDDPDDRQRLETIMDNIVNNNGRVVDYRVRQEDWTAFIAWVSYRREPVDEANKRRVNLVRSSTQEKGRNEEIKRKRGENNQSAL